MAPTNKRVKKTEAEEKRTEEEVDQVGQKSQITDIDESDDIDLESQVNCKLNTINQLSDVRLSNVCLNYDSIVFAGI